MANLIKSIKDAVVLKVGRVGGGNSNALDGESKPSNDFIEKIVHVFSKTSESFVVTSSAGVMAASILWVKDIAQKNPDLFDKIKEDEDVKWSILGKRIPLNDDLVSRLPSPESFYLQSQDYRYQGSLLFQQAIKAMKIKNEFYDVNKYRLKMKMLVPEMERFIDMHDNMENLSLEMKLKYTHLVNVISKIKNEGYLVQPEKKDGVLLFTGEENMDEHKVQFFVLYEMGGKVFDGMAEKQKEKIIKHMEYLAYQRNDLHEEISSHLNTLNKRFLNVLSDVWMIASMDEQKAQDFLNHYEYRHMLKGMDFAKIRLSKNPFAEMIAQSKNVHLLSRVTNETLVDAFSCLVKRYPYDEKVKIFLTKTWPHLTTGETGKGVDGGVIGPSLYDAALSAASYAGKNDERREDIQKYINYILKDKVNGLTGFNVNKVSKYAEKFDVLNVGGKEVSFAR